jgi:hypothetical protein
VGRYRSSRHRGTDLEEYAPLRRRRRVLSVGVALAAVTILLSVVAVRATESFGVPGVSTGGQVATSALEPNVGGATAPLFGSTSLPSSSSTDTQGTTSTTVASAAAPDDSGSAESPSTSTTLIPSSSTDAQGTTTTSVAPAPAPARVFAETSPFNTPIPDNPVLDRESQDIAATLSQKVVADLYEFGIAIYEADGSTVRVAVDCTERWGTCLLESGLQRVPDDAQPAPGSDGTLVVIDWIERRTVEMWRAVQLSNGSWSTAWGTTTPIDGTGIPAIFGNGSGVSHLAGVIRVDEIARGRIDHALVFSTSNACRDDYRYPATKTDGQSTRTDCVPEGARIQLDPSIDIESLGLTPAEHTIALALQKYGAYAVDVGGTFMAFYFEIASDASSFDPGSVYASAGLSSDFFVLQAIPWGYLRVLNSWDGG